MTEKVTTLEEFMRQLPRFHDKENNQYFYRGQNNADFLIIPSVMRGRNKGKEDIIYNYAMTECSTEFDGLESHIEILSKMQHYGVPTRLLDINVKSLDGTLFCL